MLKIKNNKFFIEEVEISLIEKTGTPVYVYSKQKLIENIRNLKNAISKYFNNYRIQYPIKANSNPYLLEIIKQEGLFADCGTKGELYIAKKTGFNLSKSTYTGNYESIEDFKYALDSGIILNLDDYTRLNEVLKIKKPDIISFRINPGIGRGGFEGIVTAGADAKFGIPYEKTYEAYKLALEKGIKKFGIHMMTGSNNLEPYYFAEITQKLTMIAGEALSKLGIKLEFINIGGGFGIPYKNDEKELDLDKTFFHIKEVFNENIRKYNLGNPALVIEPGRYIVGNTSIILSKINHIKKSYKNYIGIDSGMNTLLRPSLYKAYHRFYFQSKDNKIIYSSDLHKLNNNISKDPTTQKELDKIIGLQDIKNLKEYFITGQICENSDIYPYEREIGEVESGDLCIIDNAGAYGFSMASNYNNIPKPAEILIDKDKIILIRKREELEDIWKDIIIGF